MSMSTIQGSSSPTLYLDGPPYSDSSRSAGPVNEVALEILVVPPPIVAFVPQAIQNGSAIVDTSPRAVAARRTRVVALVIIAGIGVTAGLAGSGKLSEFGEVIAALVLVKIFALGCLYARDPVRDFD